MVNKSISGVRGAIRLGSAEATASLVLRRLWVVCDRGLLAAQGGEVSVVAYRRLMDPAAGIGVGGKATCIFKKGES